jgi:hypothetical protein
MKTRKQRGGIKCRDPTSWTPIPYDSNSCWLDTFLIAFLHYPIDYIDQLLEDAKESIRLMMNIPQNKNAIGALQRQEKILLRMLKIRSRLRSTYTNSIQESALKTMRNNIRNTLATCPGGKKFSSGKMSSTGEIFKFIADMFAFPPTMKYLQVIGNTVEDIVTNQIEITGMELLQTKTKTLDLSEMLTKPHIIYDNIRRHFQQFGPIIPIEIERSLYTSGIITTPIILNEILTLPTSPRTYALYQLVSVICNVGDHYVAYVACDENDHWLFFNDLLSEKTRISSVGKIENWWTTAIPGYRSTTPATHATWLLYVKF